MITSRRKRHIIHAHIAEKVFKPIEFSTWMVNVSIVGTIIDTINPQIRFTENREEHPSLYILNRGYAFRGWKLLPYAVQNLFAPMTEFFRQEEWELFSKCAAGRRSETGSASCFFVFMSAEGLSYGREKSRPRAADPAGISPPPGIPPGRRRARRSPPRPPGPHSDSATAR